MLYVFFGESFWARRKLEEVLSRAREKGSAVFLLRPPALSPLGSYFSGNIFGGNTLVVGDGLLDDPGYESEITTALEALAASENILILLEGELSEARQKRFKEAGAKIVEFKNPGPAKFLQWAEGKAEKIGVSVSRPDLAILSEEAEFNPRAVLNKMERMFLEEGARARTKGRVSEPNYFAFTDEVSAKRKHSALRLLRSYVKNGLGAEEAFWKLWWKIKTLRLADSGVKGTGLHPFVEKKALADLRHFSSGELEKLSFEVMDIFSEVRRGEESFEEGVEKTLLKL